MNHELLVHLHGLSGFIILSTAIFLFLFKKGTATHRIIGRVYFFTWPVNLITGYLIGSLLIVAIVFMGFYLALTGVRVAQRKKKPYQRIDKMIVSIAALVVLFMLFTTIRLVQNGFVGWSIVAGIFTVVYGYVVSIDFSRNILNRPLIRTNPADNWYIHHLFRMNLSYVTAVSAFIAVQQVFSPAELNFILPGIIGFVLVSYSRKYFRKKMARQN